MEEMGHIYQYHIELLLTPRGWIQIVLVFYSIPGMQDHNSRSNII